ncbi:hypothetical protein TWF694_011459 [Orbilia ellipsospora]|uniref:Uncharacterized protein n=1 Tax=Orbilia ellipsospora TaxID=2528407 RepID=A0AAV9X6F7_9PEZI
MHDTRLGACSQHRLQHTTIQQKQHNHHFLFDDFINHPRHHSKLSIDINHNRIDTAIHSSHNSNNEKESPKNDENADITFGIISDSPATTKKQFQRYTPPSLSDNNNDINNILGNFQLPTIKDMHHHPNIFPTSPQPTLEKSLSTCRKNHTTLQSFLKYIDPSSTSTKSGKSAIFERFTFASSVHINAFNDVTFTFPSSPTHSKQNDNIKLKDTQYLHVRGSPPSVPLTSYPKITIITSICLFSSDVVSKLCNGVISYFTANPNTSHSTLPASSTLLNHQLTLNEADSLSRLANTIADLLCTINSSSTTKQHDSGREERTSKLKVEIVLDIPQIQYYLSGPITYFSHPAISATWLQIINRRKSIIEKMFTQLINREIRRRVPGALNGVKYTITSSGGLDPILPIVTEGIVQGKLDTVAVDTCLRTLNGSEEWRTFMQHLSSTKMIGPRTLEELVYLGYVFELVLPGLNSSSPRDTLILQIDNIVESKPYLKAKKFIEGLNKSRGRKGVTLIGVYPSERVFYSKESAACRSSLHMYDPGLEFEGDGSNTGIKEVLEEVYGRKSIAGLVEVAGGLV